MVEEQEERIIPLDMNIRLKNQKDHHAIELRRVIKNMEDIKTIISCAYHEKPILIQPVFRDKLRSLASLCDSGIIHYDTDKKAYYFTI